MTPSKFTVRRDTESYALLTSYSILSFRRVLSVLALIEFQTR